MAKGFARSGCTRIAITDINPKTLSQTKDAILAINPSAEVINRSGDIADERFVDSFHDDVFQQFSRLDYAVNCAGVLGNNTVKAVDMPTESFDRLNSINYRGAWLSCRAQLRNMLRQNPISAQVKERGSIVSIASQLGIVGRSGAGELYHSKNSQIRRSHKHWIAAYCASKAAVVNMTRANAIDYSEDGIRVNCVCPGVIETPSK